MNTLINTFEKKTRTAKSDLSSLHFHNGYEFIFVTNGSVLIEIDNIPHNVKSPAIVLLNPFEQHKITGKSNDYERIILVLNSDILEQNVSPRLIAMIKCRPQDFRTQLNQAKLILCAFVQYLTVFLKKQTATMCLARDMCLIAFTTCLY